MDSLERVPAHLRERHQGFWNREATAGPLLSVGRHGEFTDRAPIRLASGALVAEGQELRPEEIAPEHLAGGHAGCLAPGEFLHGTSPYDLCWTEVLAGCTLRWRSGQVWAEPCLDAPRALTLAPDDPWLARLLAITRLQVQAARGDYPVCQPLMRGPVDMAAAALGDEAFCLALVDQPERSRALLASCTEIFIAAARAWRGAAPLVAGGSCLYGIWAPGSSVRTQCDNAALLSPALYREFLLPCDERICASFDYPLMHTHSGFIRMAAPVLLEVRGLRAVQVSLDWPAGPGVAELLPVFRQLNDHLPLIITGALERAELDLLLAKLQPAGLCLQVNIHP
ncbi:MAG: hypothetical protein IT369_14975 [Candidatus Latescibacteria bacterium]|nr:hypothetical protein [Candidatus Latescibacterota bacterium]